MLMDFTRRPGDVADPWPQKMALPMMDYRLLGEDVEVLNGVIQDDAGHGDASQGVGHIDSGVGEVAGFYT